MRKTIYKVFWAWNFDKEERWLNEMAAKGLSLISAGFCRYEFEETLPGEYAVRMQLLEHGWRHAEAERYIAFLEETGVQQVGSCLRWVYFRRKKAQGDFELFSDNASRVRQLVHILQMIALVGGMNLLAGACNVGLYAVHRMSGNLVGFLNLLLGLLCMLGALRLRKKVKQLRQEQQLFE